MPAQLTIPAAIASLYPPEASVHFSAQVPPEARLLPAELEITSGMVEKRHAEFRHGRYCARTAMQQLGVAPTAIVKGPDREPVWPSGVIGSITHTGSAAAAVVAKTADLAALGLDMEPTDPLTADLISMICLPEENPDRDGTRGKLLFSIKESIYKCLFPIINEYVDFLDMEVVLEEATMTYAARPRAAHLDSKLIASLQGRYIYQSGFVISAAWINKSCT